MKPSILLVDDESDVRKVLANFLKNKQFEENETFQYPLIREVRFKIGDNKWYTPDWVKLDSGAHRSTFGIDIADKLKIEIKRGEKETYTVADKREGIGYLHWLTIKIPGHKKEIPMRSLFLPKAENTRLLGGVDFFNEFGVILDSTHIPVRSIRRP